VLKDKTKKNLKLISLLILLILAAFWRLTLLQAIPGEEDNFTFNLPYKAIFADFLKKNRLPFWSPYAAFGFPQYAQTITASFYLIDILFYRFLPLTTAFNYTLLLHLLLTAVFTFYFARSINISAEGSFLSAFTFTFCGWMLGLLGAVQNFYPLAWFPLNLFLIESYFQRRKPFYLLLLSLTLAQSILASFPQITLYVIYGSSFYFFWRTLFSHENLKRKIYLLSLWIAILIIAASLSAVWLFPLWEINHFAPRAKGVSLTYAQQGSFNPLFLVFNLYPNLFLGKHGLIGRYICLYAGVLTLLFAFFSLTRKDLKQKALFFLCLLLFSFLFSLGKYNPFYFLLLKLPFFHYFRQPWRILFLFEFSLAVLAGLGFDCFSAQKRKTNFLFCLFFLFSALGSLLFLFFKPVLLKKFSSPKITAALLSFKPSYVFLPAIILIVSSTLIWLYQKGLLNLTSFKKASLTLVVLDLLLFGWQGKAFNFFPIKKYLYYYEFSAGGNFLKKDRGIYRIYSLSVPHQDFSPQEIYPSKENFWKDTMNLLLPSNNMLFKIETAAQSDFALGLRNTIKINELLEGKNAEGHKYDPKNKQRAENYSKLLGFLNVKYILSKESLCSPRYLLVKGGKYKIYLNKDFLPRALVINDFSMPSKPIVPTLKGFNTELRLSKYIEKNSQSKNRQARILKYQPTEIIISTKSNKEGYLLLTDTFYPGWKATVNGKKAKIYLSDFAFRAAKIPKGECLIKFQFQPKSYQYGLLVSSIAAILWTAVFFSLIIYDQQSKKPLLFRILFASFIHSFQKNTKNLYFSKNAKIKKFEVYKQE